MLVHEPIEPYSRDLGSIDPRFALHCLHHTSLTETLDNVPSKEMRFTGSRVKAKRPILSAVHASFAGKEEYTQSQADLEMLFLVINDGALPK